MSHQHSCAVVERWIHLSFDGELPPEIEPQLDRHLDICDGCRDFWEQTRTSKDELEAGLHEIAGTLDGLLGNRLERSVARFDELEARRRARVSPAWLTPRRALAILIVGVLFTGSVWMGWGRWTPGSGAVVLARASWRGVSGSITSGAERVELRDGADHGITGQDELTVPPGAEVTLSYVGSNTRVEIQGPARFSLRREFPDQHFQLRSGRAEFTVAPTAGGFLVRTPAAVIRVVGTHFTVEHDETVDSGNLEYPGLSKIEVIEGHVVFWRRSWLRDRGSYQPLPLVSGDRGEVLGRRVQTFHQRSKRGTGSISKPAPPTVRQDAPSPPPDGRRPANRTDSGHGLDLPRRTPRSKPDHR